MVPYRVAAELRSIRDHVAERSLAHGRVFRREQLPAWNVDPDVLRPMVRRKWWLRLRHGVYVDAAVLDASSSDPTDRHLLDCAAAISALPLPSYAFASTAAALHGMPFDRRLLQTVDLVRDSGTDVRALQRRIRVSAALPQVDVRTHSLAPASLTIIRGVPTVSRAVAAVTTAAQSDPEWALAIFDAAAWRDARVIPHLTSIAKDWPVLRGIGVVRSVLPLARTGSQTPLESISRYRLVRHGIDEPELQVPLHDHDGLIGFADMAWLKLGVIGEADGLAKYESRDDYLREKIREDRIRALGFIVVRWTWDQIIRDTPSVVARIRHAASIAHSRAS